MATARRERGGVGAGTIGASGAGRAVPGFSARQAQEFAAGRAEFARIAQLVRHPGAPPTARGVLPTSVISGDVWVPGGLRRLQSGWDGRSPSGGFDSRPSPPIEPWSRGLSHNETGPVVTDWSWEAGIAGSLDGVRCFLIASGLTCLDLSLDQKWDVPACSAASGNGCTVDVVARSGRSAPQRPVVIGRCTRAVLWREESW